MGKPNNIHDIEHRGKKSFFTEDEEQKLYEFIKEVYIDNHFFFDDECLKFLAKLKWDMLYLDNKNINDIGKVKNNYDKEEKNKDKSSKPNNKNIFKASNGWINDFKKKWGLSTFTSNPTRKVINPNNEEIKTFYKIYRDKIENIKDRNVFNMDETFWRLVNGSLSVIGLTGSENRKVLVGCDVKSGFTSIFIISSDGQFLKPVIVVKGKTLKCLKKIGQEDDTHVYCKYSESGWIDNKIMLFVLHVIYEITKGSDSLLILDRYSVHMTKIIIDEAKKLNIILLFVPTGCTSTNQPLDVSINGPIKSTGKKLAKRIYVSNPCEIPTIKDSVNCLIEAKKSIKKSTIINSFIKACFFIES